MISSPVRCSKLLTEHTLETQHQNKQVNLREQDSFGCNWLEPKWPNARRVADTTGTPKLEGLEPVHSDATEVLPVLPSGGLFIWGHASILTRGESFGFASMPKRYLQRLQHRRLQRE